MGYEITQYHKSSYMCIEEWGGHDFQLHFHAEIELSLILSGEAVFIINKHKYKLEAGDIILVILFWSIDAYRIPLNRTKTAG